MLLALLLSKSFLLRVSHTVLRRRKHRGDFAAVQFMHAPRARGVRAELVEYGDSYDWVFVQR